MFSYVIRLFNSLKTPNLIYFLPFAFGIVAYVLLLISANRPVFLHNKAEFGAITGVLEQGKSKKSLNYEKP
jgi:hypothetical protein